MKFYLLNHQKTNPKIYRARAFLSNLGTEKSKKDFYLPKIILKLENKVIKIPVPLNEIPLYYSKKSLYFNREQQGKYYGMKIDSNGIIQILPPVITQLSARSTTCPQDLVELFRQEKEAHKFYTDIICRKIWDKDQEKFITYIQGRSCQ